MKNTLSPSSSLTYPFSWLAGGLPKVGLIGIHGSLGSGKTQAVIQFLNENPDLKVAWIESSFTLYPNALSLYGMSLNQALFLHCGSLSSSVFWSATQVLMSQLFQIAILYHPLFAEIELRRLQILARQTQTLILILQDSDSKRSQVHWPFLLELETRRNHPDSLPTLTIMRSKNSELWQAQV